MSAGYEVAPVFLIRMAGMPFELIEKLSTCNTAGAGRELIARWDDYAHAKKAVEDLLRSRRHNLSKWEFRAWRKATRLGVMPEMAEPPSPVFLTFREAASRLALSETAFSEALQHELEAARQALLHSARMILPRYLVFATGGIRELLADLLENFVVQTPLPPRKKSARARERHLLLYLQRICTKNDTLSEFGPSGWGKVLDGIRALTLVPAPEISRRETFLERWTAHGAAAALNADPEIRMELSPRLHPNGRIEDNKFIFAATGETISLSPEILALLGRIDGVRPAYSFGVDSTLLQQLVSQNIIRWEVEVPALDPYAFETLAADVSNWRDTPVRRRWLDLLQPIAALSVQFAEKNDTMSRIEIMGDTGKRLSELGVAREGSDRSLYSASNPICEECFRECGFTISSEMVNEVARQGAPWIDLWRDCYAFAASRVAAGLCGLFEKMPLADGAIALPAFLKHCAALKMPLTGPGLVAFSHMAFQEVKAMFREQFGDRANLTESELTADDCQFVRRAFSYERFDEYTYPSADLQLSAKSTEAAVAGHYQWILAELHPPSALIHHGLYWSCPEHPVLWHALARTIFERPNFHFGFFAADFTSTTTVRLFEALPKFTNFVASQRANPSWRRIAPAEAEVYVDAATGDVCLRRIDNREYLGSFARSWLIPLGFHPFGFSLGPTTPRFYCGNVIVQRRAWTVKLEELGKGDFTGISRDLVLAVERLRAARDLPRYIYIRPTEQALRRSGVEGRDKDTKPVFIDLESYLFLEIFHRWLTKAGELEVTEMLPGPDQLFWKEADGRRTFELRTLIVPRS